MVVQCQMVSPDNILISNIIQKEQIFFHEKKTAYHPLRLVGYGNFLLVLQELDSLSKVCSAEWQCYHLLGECVDIKAELPFWIYWNQNLPPTRLTGDPWVTGMHSKTLKGTDLV